MSVFNKPINGYDLATDIQGQKRTANMEEVLKLIYVLELDLQEQNLSLAGKNRYDISTCVESC